MVIIFLLISLMLPVSGYAGAYTPNHGDVLKVRGENRYYIIINGEKRLLANKNLLREMGLNNIKQVESRDIREIPEGLPITSKILISPFPDGTLIRLKGTSYIYLIQNQRKCYIPDPETLRAMGYRADQIVEVNQNIFDSIVTGVPIPSSKPSFSYQFSGPPPGFQQSFPSMQNQTIQPSLPSTPPSSLQNGSLISSPDSSSIYMIQNGMRRLIPNMETFKSMGFNIKDIITIPDENLQSMPLGEPINFRGK